ncbi:Hypothetical protein GbCGDNIH9_8681 [Granulibacter bethesdensis]|uniref:Uncharacterized protein n=1 Tax=Granulibacter bethesdensis TaxID=364410 RepID=A0AAC9KCB4_9PROT|nr:Hypothetical protein GbCGDNIH9_8681 [Granulibacter bethesdensis]APH62975.1 Hypothetical protein GbCGDNIH8_8681 [Granulibacter bethesdensis]
MPEGMDMRQACHLPVMKDGPPPDETRMGPFLFSGLGGCICEHS